MIAEYGFLHPNFTLLAIPLIIAATIIINLNLVKFRFDEEKSNYDSNKRRRRIYTLAIEAIMMILLSIALASPYKMTETKDRGNPSLVILADNSSSFSIFEDSIAETIKGRLEKDFPVAIKSIASKERSALGDAVLNNMQGDDNILLVTDGRSTYGRDLGDILQFAYELNSTISMLKLSPKAEDASIEILGSSQQVEQVETEFLVAVHVVGKPSCTISLEVNGNIIEKRSKLEDFVFTRPFPEGTHKIMARLECKDFFPQNNVFYKTVHIIPKPRVLLVSKAASPLDHVLTRYYRYERLAEMPSSIDEYDTVVINNYNADELRAFVPKLSDYVADGSGLVVVGGKNSYDLGNYKNSLIEALMPVQVGVADKTDEAKSNVVVVIDISGSTGATFGSGSSSKKVDIEKALALDILKDIRANDIVAVVAFNNMAYEVSPLSPLSEKKDIADKISRLQDSGGTEMLNGLRMAYRMMAFAQGGKNIVVISDGATLYGPTVLGYAETLARSGIRIHSVGVGQNTDRAFMSALANSGNGIYLEPTEHQQLKIIFDKGSAEQDDKMRLATLNRNHFITKKLELDAEVTGFNQAVPKQSARTLVTTLDGNTIVAEQRFGLGRVVSVTTDDGSMWSGQLFSTKNSVIWTRIINYAVGNPARKSPFYVQMEDVHLGEPITIRLKSDSFPSHDTLTFTKVGEKLYEAMYMPREQGFYDFFGSSAAANYPLEYKNVGLNQELQTLVGITGGKSFALDEADKMKEFIKITSMRVKREIRFLRWPFVAAAMIIFLILLIIRRLDR